MYSESGSSDMDTMNSDYSDLATEEVVTLSQ
jgi:hypothetical protein